MKKLLLMLLIAGVALSAGSCKKDEDGSNGGGGGGNLTDRQKLTAKSWTSYQIKNGGNDVTSSVSSITFNFNDNGNFTASGFSGGGSGNWNLSGSILDMGSSGQWTVKNLTASNLKLDYSNGAIEIYLN
ncbi:hypothetical protein BH09BAC1_BH09BAC1_23610 [soil metagenome]